MTLNEAKQFLTTELAEKGTATALTSLLNNFGISHPNFAGITFREANEKNIVLTTEGLIGENEKQEIRVPENIFDFPLDFVLHLLAHEFVHIEQRARPNYNSTREEREFEAYYNGVFPSRFGLPPCPNFLRLQFCKAIDRYFQQMNDDLKAIYQTQYNEVKSVKTSIESSRLA